MKDRYHDNERLALGAVWADDAHRWLARQLQCGAIVGTTVESNNQLETLRDGLMVLSDTLNALAMPYPPPSMSPQRKLRLIK
jgi:hypothetical protein